jgi:hypothetical protein
MTLAALQHAKTHDHELRKIAGDGALAPRLLRLAVAAGAAGVSSAGGGRGALRGCARAVRRIGPAAAGRFLLAVVGALGGGPGRRGTGGVGRGG